MKETLQILFNRYRLIIEPLDNSWRTDEPEGTDFGHILWMIDTALKNIDSYPIDKLNRWLGFIQGVLAARNLIMVQEERNFSRPLFHKEYTANQIAIPETLNKPL